jgi:pyruvate dehydrogenase E1 component
MRGMTAPSNTGGGGLTMKIGPVGAGEVRERDVRECICGFTPYVNTIPVDQQAPFPGDLATEHRIKSLIRWNAMAMVVNANRKHSGIGGHISTFASCATLYEVGFNHFFRGATVIGRRTWFIFQGHATAGQLRAGISRGAARRAALQNFRQELAEGGDCLPIRIRI